MTGIHGEKFRSTRLSVSVNNLNLILKFEMTYDGNAAVRVGGCDVYCCVWKEMGYIIGDGQNEIEMREKI